MIDFVTGDSIPAVINRCDLRLVEMVANSSVVAEAVTTIKGSGTRPGIEAAIAGRRSQGKTVEGE